MFQYSNFGSVITISIILFKKAANIFYAALLICNLCFGINQVLIFLFQIISFNDLNFLFLLALLTTIFSSSDLLLWKMQNLIFLSFYKEILIIKLKIQKLISFCVFSIIILVFLLFLSKIPSFFKLNYYYYYINIFYFIF